MLVWQKLLLVKLLLVLVVKVRNIRLSESSNLPLFYKSSSVVCRIYRAISNHLPCELFHDFSCLLAFLSIRSVFTLNLFQLYRCCREFSPKAGYLQASFGFLSLSNCVCKTENRTICTFAIVVCSIPQMRLISRERALLNIVLISIFY